ncbi:hypothetical protein [Pedobacter agri]|uniref:hypothetical protein n=1 Tax=Pedobacter agri TaxID=454586 RepID=UPI00293131F0|nr:hypothetical protein [Pedobacter agri]
MKKKASNPSKPLNRSQRPLSFSDRIKKTFRDQQIIDTATIVFDYYAQAFHYLHSKIYVESEGKAYRRTFWNGIPEGQYTFEPSQEYFNQYRSFLELKMKQIIEQYSVSYWLHLSRRIAPNTLGSDKRDETILVCRNIMIAAFQKYAQLLPCQGICYSKDIDETKIFKGLFQNPEFSSTLKAFRKMPNQLVLANFDDSNLLEYYELEKLCYEMWYVGSKARVIAKGADLIVSHRAVEILLDNRTNELERLIEQYDNRERMTLNVSATGTVFKQNNGPRYGEIILTELLTDRSTRYFQDEFGEQMGIRYLPGHFPNYKFAAFDIQGYLKAHMFYGAIFLQKWGVRLEFVVFVIADIALSLRHAIFEENDSSLVHDLYHRSYILMKPNQMRDQIKRNWTEVSKYMDMELLYDESEIEKAIALLSLDVTTQATIHVDSFGPLKLFIPGPRLDLIFMDFSIVGEILFNLFYGLPMLDFGDKGQLLEDALKTKESYLPTGMSKGLDGSSKQVDYSVAKGNVLILVECKAVARSFGIFGGQVAAQQHRIRNVIEKGLGDVDKKIDWFMKHKIGANYDISQFTYLVGVVISAFSEFIHSEDERYWLNDDTPRILTISEFHKLIDTDVEHTLTKNLVALS